MTLPVNAEVEAAVVNRLLLDPSQITLLAGRLRAEDFAGAYWRKAYTAMQELAGAGKTVDVITLADALDGETEELSSRLADVSHYRSPVEEYADIIIRDSFRRRLIVRLESVIHKAEEVESQEDLLAELHDALVEVSIGVGDDRLISPETATNLYLDSLKDRRGGKSRGLSWGLPSMDLLLNPASAGQMIVLAARPSVGKTALAEQTADLWSQHGPVLFVSLEMSLQSLLDRMVARTSGVSATHLVRGAVTDEEYDIAEEAAEARRSSNLWYLDDPFATTASVRAAASKVRVVAGGLSAIVIDYIQLLKDDDKNSEVSRVTKISRQVKAIAREFEVPVLALSQLSRAVMQRDDQHPQLHDLRESGAIEQDADVVLGLYRPLGRDTADLDILKQRNGEVSGRIGLRFDHDRVCFEELAGTPLPDIYKAGGLAYGQSRQEEGEWI